MPRLNLTEEETRTLILDNADRLFTEIGYDKTTVADIARACGFSSSNVHRVFGTKAVINRAIAERKLSGKLDMARAAIAKEETAAGRLGAFYQTIFNINRTIFTEHQRVHHMVSVAIEERWEEVRAYRMGLMQIGREIIEYGIERGEFYVEDVEGATRALHASGIRFCHPLAVAEMESEDDDVSLENWLTFVLRALGSKPSA